MIKQISLLLAVCMLFTMLPIGMATVVADGAASVDANLVFDMAIADANEDGVPEVTDESGNKGWIAAENGISFATPRNSNTQVKPGLELIEGTNTKALVFDVNDKYQKRTLQVNFEKDKGAQIANSDAVTVEMWIKFDAPRIWQYLFAYGCNHNGCQTAAGCVAFGASEIANYGAYHGGGNYPSGYYRFNFDPASNANAGLQFWDPARNIWENFPTGSWHHVVYTRKFVPNTDIISESKFMKNKGAWKGEVWIDGIQRGTYSSPTSTKRFNYDQNVVNHTFTDVNGESTTHTANTLSIGGGLDGTAFRGSIADFKLYTDIRTETEIKNDYNSTIGQFSKAEPYWQSVTLKNQDNQIIQGTSVPLDKATTVKAEAKLANCGEAIGILALYDKNGALVSAKIGIPDGTTGADGYSAMNISIDVPSSVKGGVKKAKLYCWDNITQLSPILSPVSFEVPLNITGRFVNALGMEINSIVGEEGIVGELEISTGATTKKNLTASLKLMRGKNAVYSKIQPIELDDNGTANIRLPLEAAADDGDELLLTVTSDAELLYKDRLYYSDQSKIVDILLVAGQSNALGQGGNATQSAAFKPELGTVYYNTMGNNTLSTSGNIGWDTALGKTWHEETGRTVLVVKATWGGTGFPTKPIDAGGYGSDRYGFWNPDNEGSIGVEPRDCYTNAKNMYEAAVNSVKNKAGEGYTIGRRVYFWMQGCNENNTYSPAEYEEAFMELHNKFITEFGVDEGTRLQCGGILPVRSGSGSAADTLKLTGPRTAQYNMAGKRDDIYIAVDAMEHWASDADVAKWFEAKYEDSGYYTTVFDMPKVWADVMSPADNIHYLQPALNEFGVEAARNMLTHLRDEGMTDGIDIITATGIEHIENGGTIILPDATTKTVTLWDGTESEPFNLTGVIPVFPASSGISGTFTISGAAAELTDGVLSPKVAPVNDFATLTATYTVGGTEKTMTFKVYSPLVS